MKLQAITFDWYGTLATHRDGVGRGRRYHAYLASQGLSADPWERGVLFDVFGYYADFYRPALSGEERRLFWNAFTQLLFKKTNVSCDTDRISFHADAIEEIFGSGGFTLFDEVPVVLSALKAQGISLAVISNWQRGLHYFCEELGVASHFRAIVSSADVGCEKPEPRIFWRAVAQLGVPPEHVLHVGDSVEEDFKGASRAGLKAILLDRRDAYRDITQNRIRSLDELQSVFEAG